MTYKDNQPTFNVGNRKVVNFKDYLQNKDAEKDKLTKADLQSKPNSEEQQKIGNKRTEYNPVTHKLTDYSVDEIEDTLDAMEETNEGVDNSGFGGNFYGSDDFDDDDFDDDLEEINNNFNIASNALHMVKRMSEGREDLNDINEFASDTIQKIINFRNKRGNI